MTLKANPPAGPHGIGPAIGWSLIRLRRDGLQPLRFSGQLIAQYDGRLPATRLWHELALFRTVDARYVVKIVAWHRAAPDPSRIAGSDIQAVRCHATLFETLDDALGLLENHNAVGDICPTTFAPALAAHDPAVPATTRLMQATMLQGFCEDVLRRYRIGVGALLAGIGLRAI